MKRTKSPKFTFFFPPHDPVQSYFKKGKNYAIVAYDTASKHTKRGIAIQDTPGKKIKEYEKNLSKCGIKYTKRTHPNRRDSIIFIW